jgi:hypothetical protein
MYVPLLEEYLDSLYNESNYIIPGFIYKRTVGSMFENKGSFDMITDDFTDATPAAISIDHTWDNSTREVNGSVEVIFDSVPEPGDFRVGLMITEDLVKGGSQYNQKSYFNSSSVYPELNGLGDNISGYEHVDVFRDTVFGGIPGRAGIIPETPEVGKSYTVDFTYATPDQYISLDVIDDNLKLIAFVGYSDGENLNAAEAYVTEITGNKIQPSISTNANKVTVHQTTGKGISFTIATFGRYIASLYNSNGKVLSMSEIVCRDTNELHTISRDNKKFSKGVYFLNIKGECFTSTIPIVFYQ